MTRQEAIDMAKSGWWVGKTWVEIARFQLFEPRIEEVPQFLEELFSRLAFDARLSNKPPLKLCNP